VEIAMYQPDVVYALMRDGEELEAVLADLTSHGVRPEDVEVSVPDVGRYELADELLHDDARGTFRTAGLGAAIGGAVGLAAAGVVDVTGGVGVTGWLVVGFGGAGFGGMIGAMTGLQRHDRPDDDPVTWRDLDDPSGWRMVAVHSLHWRNRAHEILLRHGATILEPPSKTRPGLV
jgi:hypothetical protein